MSNSYVHDTNSHHLCLWCHVTSGRIDLCDIKAGRCSMYHWYHVSSENGIMLYHWQ